MELSRAVVSDQGTPLKNEAFYTNYPRKLIDLIWSPLASLRTVSHTLYNDILHIVHCGIREINRSVTSTFCWYFDFKLIKYFPNQSLKENSITLEVQSVYDQC